MRASFLLRSAWVPVFLLASALPVSMRAGDERWIDLSGGGLEPWVGPRGDWFIAGSAAVDPHNPKMLTTTPGNGVLVNGPKGNTVQAQLRKTQPPILTRGT